MTDALWQAVDRALDARRDPLGDDTVLEHLVEHPEDLGEIEAFVVRLERLPDAAPPPAWTGTRRVAAVLFLAGLAVTVWLLLRDTAVAAPPPAQAASLDAVPPILARVLDVEVRFTRSGPHGTQRTTWRPGQRRDERFGGPAPTHSSPDWSLTWTTP